MNKSIEKLLLSFKEMTKTKLKLAEEERKRFANVSFNRIYNMLLEMQGYDAGEHGKQTLIIKAINPSTGEVIYEGNEQGRTSLTALGYKLKMDKHGEEIYVKRQSVFENNSQ